jgi:hypothetical protein
MFWRAADIRMSDYIVKPRAATGRLPAKDRNALPLTVIVSRAFRSRLINAKASGPYFAPYASGGERGATRTTAHEHRLGSGYMAGGALRVLRF